MSCGFANSDKHKMMEAKEVINMINKGQPVQISDKIITGDLDFTQIKDKSVGTDISLVHNISQNVVFVKCGASDKRRKPKTSLRYLLYSA